MRNCHGHESRVHFPLPAGQMNGLGAVRPRNLSFARARSAACRASAGICVGVSAQWSSLERRAVCFPRCVRIHQSVHQLICDEYVEELLSSREACTRLGSLKRAEPPHARCSIYGLRAYRVAPFVSGGFKRKT
eukprot:7391666-Prymnesium_polylepis.4